MELRKYLKRIDFNFIPKVNLSTLQQLQLQHMLRVPFENLDVMHRDPIPLDIETYYKNIVLNHRGGICYELNGLFNGLLQNLGFNSHFISGTIARSDGSWAMEGSHVAQIVELDQPYLVDVGFGDTVRIPIPLTGETRKDIGGVYRVVVVEVKRNIYDLLKEDKDYMWNTLFRFDITPRRLMDFDEADKFYQTSPKSHFTQKEFVSIATLDGRVTLSGDSLIITHQGNNQKLNVKNSDKAFILYQYFGIHLDNFA